MFHKGFGLCYRILEVGNTGADKARYIFFHDLRHTTVTLVWFSVHYDFNRSGKPSDSGAYGTDGLIRFKDRLKHLRRFE
ncbi:hypothetical protein [Paenibacillus glacialis]|uniref:Uncharacterized protein n=1 Tax=Paenibacillus glacialis TaxID=494026 RepID=A0A168FBI1_9BACL|nr:hypothetical protein [Paenibacillus glacialis]OAB36048.1 hypothetical protein PGLA_21775 [Paenibacillus glacialis]